VKAFSYPLVVAMVLTFAPLGVAPTLAGGGPITCAPHSGIVSVSLTADTHPCTLAWESAVRAASSAKGEPV
jgi:hypothetical protein